MGSRSGGAKADRQNDQTAIYTVPREMQLRQIKTLPAQIQRPAARG
ncbi:hypothetical protein TNCV_4441881, partial [Trichonephila clavipes]